MSIARFFTTSVAVSRMEWENDSSGEVSSGSFMGHVQQARPEFAESIGEAHSQTFLIWCPVATDVESGDTLTIASGDYAGTYSVRNVMQNAIGINNQHLELVVMKDVS